MCPRVLDLRTNTVTAEEVDMLTASATIVYDMHKGTKDFTPNWVRGITSFDFKRLYAYFMLKQGVRLDIGSQYGAHISVVKGERIPNPDRWKYKNGKTITFEYWPLPRGDNDKHIWIDVYSESLRDIRATLGLPDRKKFHITIGRLTDSVSLQL